ncbi:MAG: Txe/YoeB family addiction module toxin [Saprospiraceae bacterium]|nr:Txe/YoeB family addiction module toxin [Saprospiraceae bacterium]
MPEIKELIKSIKVNPFKRTGKPEPLKHGLESFWSRRITQEHRLLNNSKFTRGNLTING